MLLWLLCSWSMLRVRGNQTIIQLDLIATNAHIVLVIPLLTQEKHLGSLGISVVTAQTRTKGPFLYLSSSTILPNDAIVELPGPPVKPAVSQTP